MSMLSFKYKGNFSNTENFLKKALRRNYMKILEKYAQQGVEALASATPIGSGETASSWYYTIIQNEGNISIVWNNHHVNKGVNIAVILQYGHATRNGGYVEGRDYINPAIQPIFDKLAEAAWKEVTSI